MDCWAAWGSWPEDWRRIDTLLERFEAFETTCAYDGFDLVCEDGGCALLVVRPTTPWGLTMEAIEHPQLWATGQAYELLGVPWQESPCGAANQAFVDWMSLELGGDALAAEDGGVARACYALLPRGAERPLEDRMTGLRWAAATCDGLLGERVFTSQLNRGPAGLVRSGSREQLDHDAP